MIVDGRICIFSYQSVHRKTIDTLCRLKLNGYTNVIVYAMPFHYSKSFIPYITHRPVIEETDSLNSFDYKMLVRNLGYEVREIMNYAEIDEMPETVFLVCGAGIIPDEIIHKYRIINAHPGYIPMARGLDALKWAIWENCPIGVTTHILGDYVDAGNIIERREVPVYKDDTFHALAYRQYDTEIDMLVRAIEKVDCFEFFTDGENYPVHRRMPHEIEDKLYSAFDTYKMRTCSGCAAWGSQDS